MTYIWASWKSVTKIWYAKWRQQEELFGKGPWTHLKIRWYESAWASSVSLGNPSGKQMEFTVCNYFPLSLSCITMCVPFLKVKYTQLRENETPKKNPLIRVSLLGDCNNLLSMFPWDNNTLPLRLQLRQEDNDFMSHETRLIEFHDVTTALPIQKF